MDGGCCGGDFDSAGAAAGGAHLLQSSKYAGVRK
jgi:hypothetical protein